MNIKKWTLYRRLAELRLDLSWMPQNLLFNLNFSKLKKDKKMDDIKKFEKRVFSQNGEDGILESIYQLIGTTNKYFVEFGVEDGKECNTRYLREKHGWYGLLMDMNYANEQVKQEAVTAGNVETLFSKYKVPKDFDLLSIDIDSYDYWVWKAIKDYSPRVVVIEYNSGLENNRALAINPNPNTFSTYHEDFRGGGANLIALYKLGKEKGYTLVGCESKGINAFFIRDELVENHFTKRPLEELYVAPSYGQKIKGRRVGFAPQNIESFVEV